MAGCRSAYQPKPLFEKGILDRLDATVSPPALSEAGPAKPLDLDRALPVQVESLSLTLAQAQVLAIVRHPALRRIRAERGLADAAQMRAGSRPDPEISASALWITPQAVLGALASLRWELLASGTQDARRGLAGALRASVDARIAAEEWRIAQEARIAWLELAAREREGEIAAERVELARETLDFARRMLERGATTGVETAVIDLESAEAERDRTAAQGELRSARARLAEAAALPFGASVRTQSDGDPIAPLEPRVPSGDPDAALLERRPELRDARARYAVAERELELAHLGAQPRVSLGPDLERDTDSTKLGGGASVVLPVTDANRAAILEAESRREIAAREFEAVLFEARARLSRARSGEDAAARSLAVHETRVAPASRAVLAAAERAVQAGASDLLALLLARQRALQAAQAGIALRAAHAVAVARLEAAYGPEPPDPVSEAAVRSGGVDR